MSKKIMICVKCNKEPAYTKPIFLKREDLCISCHWNIAIKRLEEGKK